MRAAIVSVGCLVAITASAEPRWKPLMPAVEKRRIAAVCAVGDELLAVGERAWRSHDRGATWSEGVVLESDPGFVAGAFALHCRNPREAWAVGVHGQIWRSRGDVWDHLRAPTKNLLLDVAGNDALIIAVGEKGTVLTSRDGAQFSVEKIGTRSTLRRVLVADDGRAWALGDDGVLRTRTAAGAWHGRPMAPRDPLAALARDGAGRLHLLSTSGRRWRSDDDGKTFIAEAALDGGSRGSCDDLAAAGTQIITSCRRATGNLLAMDPPMHDFLFVSDDAGAHEREEAPEPGLGRLWSTASGPIYAAGANVWRRLP